MGARRGPSAGGTGTRDQSSAAGVMPPFSGLTRMAAGSFFENQLLPSQPASVAMARAPSRARERNGDRTREAMPCHAKTRGGGQETGRISCTAGPIEEGSLTPSSKSLRKRSERAKYGQGHLHHHRQPHRQDLRGAYQRRHHPR